MRSLAVLLLAILILPTATALHTSPSAEEETTRLSRSEDVTWRSVAFHPSQNEAVLVGGYEKDNRSRSLVAEWTPETGLEEVYNRSGPTLVDVDVREDGTQLVVGLRNLILLGEPGSYRNVWNESQFASDTRDLTFYGLGAAFAPEGEFGIVTGSSLLRVDADGSLEVVHGGEDAFFRSIDFNPISDYALVEAAVEREDRAVLGTVWRTNGFAELTQEDHVSVYGRFERGDALLNAISFAPNGTFAMFAGRDGAGASFMTWASQRSDCHTHDNSSRCHDHSYRHMAASKPTGPVTCVDWHPSGRYALVAGLEEDVLGYADDRTWIPLAHRGPGLLDCAFAPDGSSALAVGRNGTVVRVDPGSGPLVTVLDPKPGRLAPPDTDQRFLIGVLDRGPESTTNVTAHLEGKETRRAAAPTGSWWTVSVETGGLEEGRHRLVVNARGPGGETAGLRFPFLVNNDAFQPSTPTIRSPTGLEATNRDSDGLFTIRWDPLDEPVVYQIHQTLRGQGANATETIAAGSGSNATVRVHQDGTYSFRVRALNSYATGNWSESVSVKVVLDTDGDGVPDKRDPQPHTPNQWGDPDGDDIPTDTELKQCSDPYDEDSTPTSDDDGDGLPNGIECEQGTDPRDPDDPPRPDDDGQDGGPNNSANDSDDPGTNDSPGGGLLAVLFAAGWAALARRSRA